MALINCPECSKEISDQVRACPHCGFPLDRTESDTQKVEISSVNLKLDEKKKKKYFKMAIIGIALLLMTILTLNFVGKAQEKKAAEEKKKTISQYREKIVSLQTMMISTGADAEEMINLTSKVWGNSIREEADPATDKYTKMDGYGSFWDDFNIALGNLYDDPDIIAKVTTLESNGNKINVLMKDIQNPPDNYTKVYETLLEAHSDLSGVISLAVSPSGSLTSFNQESRQKIDAFIAKYKMINTILPNEDTDAK